MLTLALFGGYLFSMWFITEVGGYLGHVARNGARSAANRIAEMLSLVWEASGKTAENLAQA
jgi:hypothetical protein